MTNTQGLRKNYLQIQGEVVFHLELHTRCTRKAQIIRAKHIVVCRKNTLNRMENVVQGAKLVWKGEDISFQFLMFFLSIEGKMILKLMTTWSDQWLILITFG